MAIGTYAQLKTAVENWRERVDQSVITGNAADFITLGEAQLTTDLPLRIMWVNTPLTGVTSDRELDLPTDYMEPEWLKLTSNDRFSQIPKRSSKDMQYFSTSGEPSEWCINGDHIDLNRPCSSALTFQLRYRQKYALSDASPTNWLLTNFPNIYLAAVLVWSGLLLKDGDIATWSGVYSSGVDALKKLDAKAETDDIELKVDPALLRNNGGYMANSSLLGWTNDG